MKRGHQSIGTHDDGTLRELVVVLVDPSQVIPGRVCLADCSRGEVHDLVPVATYVSIQLRHTHVCPVPPNHSKDMTQSIGSGARSVTSPYGGVATSLGNGAINIRNDYMIGSIPDKDSSRARRNTRSIEGERDGVRTFLQIEFFLQA